MKTKTTTRTDRPAVELRALAQEAAAVSLAALRIARRMEELASRPAPLRKAA